ncbi:unnamed protein product [Prunus armeniaca]
MNEFLNTRQNGSNYNNDLLVVEWRDWILCAPQDGTPIGDTNLGSKKAKPGSTYRFGEKVNQLVMGGDMRNMKSATSNFFVNKMELSAICFIREWKTGLAQR